MTNFIRKCPICDNTIYYSNKYSMLNADKKNSNCKSCGLKLSMTDERKERMRQRVLGINNPMYGKYGELNPFFGKKHSDETKRKILDSRDNNVYKTDEFRKKMSQVTTGKNNPMYGKTFYGIWEEKYGKDIADEKLIEFKKKISYSVKGEKNPMYGKPAPINSGNGICGWYKGWFFRSILELSYMIFVIERFNLKWESGENNKYVIQYKIDNVDKNYFPDFIINNKYIIECKPKKLWNTNINREKFRYAKIFCDKNNFIFKVTDIRKIKKEELKKLISDGLVLLTNKWKDKL